MSIHPTAIVEPSARIHDTADIGPYSIIGADVEIGADTRIGPHVVIGAQTRIGEGNQIYQFASVGELSQDMTAKPSDNTWTLIGDRNVIRENVTINRGTLKEDGTTRIGSDNWIMAYCHVAHDCQIGSHTIFANNASLAGHVHIGDWVILGGFTLIHQFCRMGAHSFTGYASGLDRDVPPFVLVDGNPAVPRGINTRGLQRRGFDRDAIRRIKEAYRTIYRKELRLPDALEALREHQDDEHVASMIQFIEASQRGLQR
ncbi:MAG: acyl-ACP--UDP-N-acetylglucosamine O-acyltransferase [Abyssibacter sp.]|uniref:acyl-ACP--UDP-N-acetylglucosamine O-acyltransferase n=1 Tax=Abyssibacter sp. TaxID=2320200 RepID=UPI00321BC8DF